MLAEGPVAGEPVGGGREEDWEKCPTDNFQAFGATHGSTDDKRPILVSRHHIGRRQRRKGGEVLGMRE